MADDVKHMPPRGYYLAYDVGQLVGVSGDRIGQWMRRGYIRASVSQGPPHVYAYQDVAEAMVVHDLQERGVPLPTIKAAIDWLRVRYGYDWPLTHARLAIPQDSEAPGATPALIVVDEQPLHVDASHPVFDVDLTLIASMLERGGWAARQVPDLRHIEVDPDRLSGRPVIRSTRIPAEDVARLAAAEGGRRILREEYDLTDEQIDDAVRWWEAVEGLQAAA